MIYTLTLNPSLDYVTALPLLNRGGVNRSVWERVLPGGKGINVSLTLNALNTPNTALGFIGSGNIGREFLRLLTERGLRLDLTETACDTRINVKISESGASGGAETERMTEINGGNFKADGAELNALRIKLGGLTNRDTLVIGGSLPQGVPVGFYADITAELSGKGVRVTADVCGDALREVVKSGVFLVKPNADELGEVFGAEISDFEQAVFYGKKLIKAGSTNVLVSLGAAGAVLAAGDKVYTQAAPTVKAAYTVGAGDSLLAGFTAEFDKSGDYEKSLRFAVETASAYVTERL